MAWAVMNAEGVMEALWEERETAENDARLFNESDASSIVEVQPFLVVPLYPESAIAAEREECAKVALVDRGPHGEPPAEWHDEVARVGAVATVRVAIKMTREEIAAAIRARGEAKGGAS